MAKRLTYRNKTILSTIAIVLVSLLLSGVYFFYAYYTTLRENAYDRLNNSAEALQQNLDQTFSSIDNASFLFVSTPQLREWTRGALELSGNTMTGYNNIANLRTSIEYNLLFNDAWLSKAIDSVYMVVDGQYIPLLFRQATSIKTSEHRNRQIYEDNTSRTEMAFYSMEEDGTVCMTRRISTAAQDKQLSLQFSISSQVVDRQLAAQGKDSIVNVIYQGTVLFSNHPELVGSLPAQMSGQPQNGAILNDNLTYNGQRYSMAYRSLKNDGFVLQILTPYSVITNQILSSVRAYLLVMLALMLLFTTVAGATAGAHTRFLVHLVDGMKKVSGKNYDVVLPPYRDPELDNISHVFNSMAGSIKTLINSVYQSEISLRENEIRLLQSQMNPHFLVNVLATIGTTALLEDKQNIYLMTNALSSMLETSLYTSENSLYSTIDKELDYIRCYLYIQQVRYQDHLRYAINLEDEALKDLYIPRLSIEPIVENAVIHGIEESIHGGRIDIDIGREGADVVITITDNGKGFDVAAVMGPTPPPSGGKRHHIGIRNTNTRIQLLFGGAYGISFTSSLGEGTTAEIRLPALTAPPEEESVLDQSTDRRG